MKIGFFGTPELAAKVLSACISEKEIEVVFVVTNPDAKAGRGQKLTASPVKQVALQSEIPVFTPEKLRGNTEFFKTLESYECDYFVIVAYGKILPNEILSIPKKYPINVHGSILPEYRGASPIQSVLLDGKTETGVTIMCVSEKMDEGDILSVKKIPISQEETSLSLFAKFAEVSPSVLIKTLFGLERGEISPVPQDHSKATYCSKFEKEMGRIDVNLPAKELFHRYQAYTPWPTLYGEFEGKRLVFAKVSLPKSTEVSWEFSGMPGRIYLLDNTLFLQVGDGVLILEELKLEWEKARGAEQFLLAHPSFLHTIIA